MLLWRVGPQDKQLGIGILRERMLCDSGLKLFYRDSRESPSALNSESVPTRVRDTGLLACRWPKSVENLTLFFMSFDPCREIFRQNYKRLKPDFQPLIAKHFKDDVGFLSCQPSDSSSVTEQKSV